LPTLRLSGVFHLTAPVLSGEKHLTSANNQIVSFRFLPINLFKLHS